jgi:hypothetical protein
MKKIILFLIVVLILVGCNQTTGPSTSITDEELYKGKAGLSLDFRESMPPITVHEEDSFPISLDLKNDGAFDIKNGYLLLNLEKDLLEVERGNIPEKFDLIGRSRNNPSAGLDVINFFVKSKKIGSETETITSSLLATICYEYQTYFSENVCLDTDYYNMKKISKACNAEDKSFNSGQGAPIAITKIESRMLEDNDKIKPMFIIYVNNVGKGEVISTDSVSDICSANTVNYDNINNIEVEAYLSGYLLTCSPENLKLKNKEEVVRCILEEGIDKKEPSYTTLLTITVKYGYTETISKKVEIRKYI